MSLFIHQSTCISAQKTFGEIDLDSFRLHQNNRQSIAEPKYEGIPLNVLRRMGKAVRIGTGAALPLIKNFPNIDAIIIGTANGGMDDCIRFLNQIMEFDEGTLTPTNFVQSTPNAIAGQLGLSLKNKGYNITHVHRGLAFENALIDAQMFLSENKNATCLLGGLDEISTYNYNIEMLGDWYKKEDESFEDLYSTNTEGSIAGEGAAMFLVNKKKENSISKITAIKTLHSSDQTKLEKTFQDFISENNLELSSIDLLLSGENGDSRTTHYSSLIEKNLNQNTPVARYKHFAGEFPSSGALALWLGSQFIEKGIIPSHFMKSAAAQKQLNKILIYNHYKGLQHAFVLLERP